MGIVENGGGFCLTGAGAARDNYEVRNADSVVLLGKDAKKVPGTFNPQWYL